MHASRTVAAAQQMFRSHQYMGVASLCADVLECEPDNLDLRLLRVRALMALRRDDEAQRELARVLDRDSETAEVFRLLAELAIRRGKLRAAETFLKHALRLSPGDPQIEPLLDLVQSSNQPTVAVEKLPAATATVGCTLSPPSASCAEADGWQRGLRFAHGTEPLPRPVERFGAYLVEIGALTPTQLGAALDYQRRAGVRIGTAAVALGFLSQPSVEGAARAFHVSRNC